jgi:hypothetical protein
MSGFMKFNRDLKNSNELPNSVKDDIFFENVKEN